MKILIKIKICPIKSSVQRELRRVKNSNNRWLLAWDFGTEHNFFHIGSVHVVLNIFLVPIRTAKLIGNFWINRRSTAKLFPCFDYSSVSLCCDITISVAIFTSLTSKMQQIEEKSDNFFYWGSECPSDINDCSFGKDFTWNYCRSFTYSGPVDTVTYRFHGKLPGRRLWSRPLLHRKVQLHLT
jgi:hypothetical protein